MHTVGSWVVVPRSKGFVFWRFISSGLAIISSINGQYFCCNICQRLSVGRIFTKSVVNHSVVSFKKKRGKITLFFSLFYKQRSSKLSEAYNILLLKIIAVFFAPLNIYISFLLKWERNLIHFFRKVMTGKFLADEIHIKLFLELVNHCFFIKKRGIFTLRNLHDFCLKIAIKSPKLINKRKENFESYEHTFDKYFLILSISLNLRRYNEKIKQGQSCAMVSPRPEWAVLKRIMLGTLDLTYLALERLRLKRRVIIDRSKSTKLYLFVSSLVLQNVAAAIKDVKYNWQMKYAGNCILIYHPCRQLKWRINIIMQYKRLPSVLRSSHLPNSCLQKMNPTLHLVVLVSSNIRPFHHSSFFDLSIVSSDSWHNCNKWRATLAQLWSKTQSSYWVKNCPWGGGSPKLNPMASCTIKIWSTDMWRYNHLPIPHPDCCTLLSWRHWSLWMESSCWRTQLGKQIWPWNWNGSWMYKAPPILFKTGSKVQLVR